MQSSDHSLAAYLKDGPADSSVLRIFHRVLAAIDAIYTAGSSHPPLSPQTIRLDDSDQPHIPSSNRTHETADTVAFGSAKYSAPEAFLYNGDSFGCETVDCYVLGFIFYEILIGKRSFVSQFGSLEKGPPPLWLKWHADRSMKARPLSELRPNLGNLASLVDGMMEKDPGKRINTISQALHAFSIVEAQTAYTVDPVARPTATPKFRFDLVRKRLASGATWFAHLFAALRKLRVVSGVLLAVVMAISGILAAMLVHRVIRSPSARQSVPAVSPSAIHRAVEHIPLPVAHFPPPPHQNAQVQPPPVVPPSHAGSQSPVPLQPKFELQIESHLHSGVRLSLDDLRAVALSPDRLFTEKITPGPHRVRLVTRSKAFLRLALKIAGNGDISFSKVPPARALRYVILARNAKSAKLYATRKARAGLPGQAYETVPENGLAISDTQAVDVTLGQDPKTTIHLDPLPAGSIRMVLPAREMALLVPIEIRANVPDAEMVINGEKLTLKLDKGVRVVRLRAGEYHVKLVRAAYLDSAEQDLVISGNEQQRQLQFRLSPIVSPSNTAISSVPAHDSVSVRGANPDGQAMRPFGKITFNVRPETAQISCRRQDESRAQECPNDQPCVLRAGVYEVTIKANGFKTALNHIAVGTGDDKSFQWKLEALPSASALNPTDFFEDGQTWTVDPNGWWTHTQPGYSFMRANRGIFFFDILKPSGPFVSKKIYLVVNYKDHDNRVLYTIDEHRLRRDERAPGIQIANYSVAHETPPESDYRLSVELSTDRAIIRDAEGKILDNLPLINAVAGKVGFSGKLKLKVIQAPGYSRYTNSPVE